MGRTPDREERKTQAEVLRAVLLAGDAGLTEPDLKERCEGRDAAAIESAAEALLDSGLLSRQEARLVPSGAATRFNRLRPL